MNMNPHVETIQQAADLPEHWDTAAGDQPFLKRAVLQVLEEANPCGQRYHFTGDSDHCSIAITYRHRLDLLTFGRGSFSLPITMVGAPCSVSTGGCSFAPKTQEMLIAYLRQIPGTKLVLNSTEPRLSGFRKGTTLPTCIFSNHWNSFPDYLSAMRSHYRYRIKTALSRWTTVEESPVPQGSFGNDLHKLYENVFNRSRYKLEKLGVPFFRKLPAEITRFSVDGKPIAFVQTAAHGNQLSFIFGGMDYSTSRQYDTYLNILLHVVRKGIEAGCASIDMGQTAEAIKCKLGCRMESRNLHVAHSGQLRNRILQSMAGMLSYREKEHEYRVFKTAQS